MEKQTLLSVGGVTAAVIASLCCIGPVLVVFLGVGSIAAFSVFEIYRPFFIGVTVALIGLAFYLTYRKREVACENGTCKMESASRRAKIGVWIVTILAGLVTAFPYLELIIQSPVNTFVDSTSVTTLSISGMDCSACAAGIEVSLAKIQGVRKAHVDFQSGNARVDYDSRMVAPSVFVDRVTEAGFKATIEKGK